MSPSAALESRIFVLYAELVGGLLVASGLIIAGLRFLARLRVGGIARTYFGWLVMAPLVFAVIFAGRMATVIGVCLLAVLGLREFSRATGLSRERWMTTVVYLGILAVGAATLVDDPRSGLPGWYGLFMALPVYCVGLLLMVPILRNRVTGQLQTVSLAILGFIYFGWMLGHLAFLANAPHAYGYLLFLVFAVEIGDVSAFVFGKLLGRTKLRQRVSPNKTLEGALGALAVSLAMPWLLSFSFPHFTTRDLILTGLIVGVGGQLGDLALSVIKRDLGVKDLGSSIPGHGGVLDRIDSLIFTAPLFFHMVRWFHGLYGGP